MLPLFTHQEFTAEFIRMHPRVMVTSDPGTGKTRAVLEGFRRLREDNKVSRMLVLAPLSILRPAWGGDIMRWAPSITWGVSTAGSDKKRYAAFEQGRDIVITNHDAVKWLAKRLELLKDFDMLVVDESTAFKNPNSQRSKAIALIANQFEYRTLMSGTPNPKTVLDMWHQALICDDGERLGKLYWQFRSEVCSPLRVGASEHAVQWIDRPGAAEAVADKLRDITVRFKLTDCVDMPENHTYTIEVDLSSRLRNLYSDLEREAVLMLESGKAINAVHAGAKVQKLLQLCSGAVYDNDGHYQLIHNERYELVIEQVQMREQSVVAFLWKHQKDQLIKLAKSRGITYGLIDGSVPQKEREQVVSRFQKGELQVIFAHPQSAGHGLTLTAGHATIWASPTYNAEHFEQFNARVYRAGQKKRTETLLITAAGTWEEQVYGRLQEKTGRMSDLLNIFASSTRQAV